MKRANKVIFVMRIALCCLGLTVGILVFGPFREAEQNFGITDKEAHAIAFFALTALMLIALPRLRKWDVVVITLALGGMIEVGQSLIGRSSFSLADWGADMVGVFMAIVPMVLESLRVKARQGEHVPVPRRRARDQKARPRSVQPPAFQITPRT